MFKRTIDIVFAFSLLVLAAPVLLLCALLIKLESPGPVLFRQKRMGRSFKVFYLYKLRTMTSGTQGLHYTVAGDPRITRLGAWLRRTKLDEFPQLINILRGEMSIVGPRPVVPQIAHDFRKEYELLLKVRPGLTDPASLKYCRESELLALVPDPVAYFETVVTPEKLRISSEYLQHMSAASDLGLILRTAVAVIDTTVRPSRSGRSAGRKVQIDPQRDAG